MIADRVKVDSCETCRYYLALSEKGGICRRYPPVPLYTPIQANMAQKMQGHAMVGAVTGNATQTAANNWCGEHQDAAEKSDGSAGEATH